VEYYSEEEVGYLVNIAKQFNVIILRLPCKRRCLFCYLRQRGSLLKKNISQSKFIPRKDYNKIIEALDYKKQIDFSTGDVLDYGFIYEFLDLLGKEQRRRKEHGRLIICSTFGCFDEKKIGILKRLKADIQLSFITLDAKVKKNLMNGSWSEKQNELVKKVIRSGILTQIYVWYLGDLELLKKDLATLKSLMPKGHSALISLNYPSSTRFSSKKMKQLSARALASWDKAVQTFMEFPNNLPEIDRRIFVIKDLSKWPREGCFHQKREMQDFRDRIQRALGHLSENKTNLNKAAFITAESSYPYAKEVYPNLNWIKAPHKYFGGDITTCDLLTFADIEHAIKQNTEYTTYVLSTGMVKSGRGIYDLMNVSKDDFAKRMRKNLVFA